MERDQPAGAAPARLGRLDGDPPGVPVGAPAQGAHLAVQAEQRVADPGGPRGHGHRVDRMTLGDAVQRQGQRRVLAHGAPGGVQPDPLGVAGIVALRPAQARARVREGAQVHGGYGDGHRIAVVEIDVLQYPQAPDADSEVLASARMTL